FSSRRRHTRLQGDLEFRRVLFRSLSNGVREIRGLTCGGDGRAAFHGANSGQSSARFHYASRRDGNFSSGENGRHHSTSNASRARSEERRVGKECRYRGGE